MAGSYGAEATQGKRYRLSFTVGGLLASQGRALAEMYLNHLNHAGGGDAECSSQTEVGKSIAAIRQQAVEELAYLAGPDSSTSDREALMWIAMCRYYAIVGEFAGEVLKKHYLTGNTHLDFEDYDRFIADKATWHPELETVSEGTAKKLRSNLFKAMREAHLFDKNSDTVLSFLPSPSLADILRKRADSFGYLPMRESSL